MVQLNRKARKTRKETLRIQDGGGAMPAGAIRNYSVLTFFRLDESWGLFAISAGLAVKDLG